MRLLPFCFCNAQYEIAPYLPFICFGLNGVLGSVSCSSLIALAVGIDNVKLFMAFCVDLPALCLRFFYLSSSSEVSVFSLLGENTGKFSRFIDPLFKLLFPPLLYK